MFLAAVDGTTNLVAGIPEVSVCIGLFADDRVVLGVVYNPFRDEMFRATRGGGGAFLNDQKISVNAHKTSLSEAVIVAEFGYERNAAGIARMLASVQALLEAGIRTLRVLGSGALDMCYVACGRADAVYTGVAGEGWKPWDYAAALVIAEEAGAKVCSLEAYEAPFTIVGKSMLCSAPRVARSVWATVRLEAETGGATGRRAFRA